MLLQRSSSRAFMRSARGTYFFFFSFVLGTGCGLGAGLEPLGLTKSFIYEVFVGRLLELARWGWFGFDHFEISCRILEVQGGLCVYKKGINVERRRIKQMDGIAAPGSDKEPSLRTVECGEQGEMMQHLETGTQSF